MSATAISLRDSSSGASAKIAPELGFNCFSFQIPIGGEAHEVLWAADDFLAGTARPSGSGIPLLFPFAGRIGQQRYTFEGREFRLTSDDRRGNAIHGFVLDRAWLVVEQSETRVEGRFHASQVDPTILEQWPSDFVIEVSYELRGNVLASQIVARNPGSGNLPFWLGTHPYFRVPLSARSTADCLPDRPLTNTADCLPDRPLTNTADVCQVQVPVSRYWKLDDMLPTGERLPATGAHGLAEGLAFKNTQFDDVFTGAQNSGGWCETSITDPDAGLKMRMRFETPFREVVVYNPPHREAICIEPYTAVPDAFKLSAQGIDTGLRVLAPGESFSASIEISLDRSG